MDRVQMSGTDEHAARVASIQKESTVYVKNFE